MRKVTLVILAIIFFAIIVVVRSPRFQTSAPIATPTATIEALTQDTYTDSELGYTFTIPNGLEAEKEGSQVHVGEIFTIAHVPETATEWMTKNGGRPAYTQQKLNDLPVFTKHLTSDVADQDIYIVERNNVTLVLSVESNKSSAQRILNSFTWK